MTLERPMAVAPCSPPERPDAAWIRLAATGVDVPGVQRVATELAPRILDWVTVASRSVDQGLIHASVRLARSLPAGAVPEAGLEELDRRGRELSVWALVALGELARIDEALRAARVPYLLMKGPALAVVLHGDPVGRSFGDLDLFVPRRRREVAVDVLDRLGYARARASPRGAGSWLRVRPSMSIPGPTEVDLDLHWGFNEVGQRLDLHRRGLWNRAESVVVGDVVVRTPGPEDTVVLLAAHGAKHGWGRWGWLADFGRLLRVRRQVDWGLVDRLTRETGTRRVLAAALLLAASLVAAPVPRDRLSIARRDTAARRLTRGFAARLLAGGRADPSTAEQIALSWRLRHRTHDRILDGLWICLNASDPGWVKEPALPLGPLAWPIRALGLAVRESGRALGDRAPRENDLS